MPTTRYSGAAARVDQYRCRGANFRSSGGTNCLNSQPASCSNRVESVKVTVAKETQRSTRLENAEPDSAEPFGLTEEQADTDRLLRRLLGTALADRLRRFLPPRAEQWEIHMTERRDVEFHVDGAKS